MKNGILCGLCVLFASFVVGCSYKLVDCDRIFLVESGQKSVLKIKGIPDEVSEAAAGQWDDEGKCLLVFSKNDEYVAHRTVAKGRWKKCLGNYGEVDLTMPEGRYIGAWPKGEGALYDGRMVLGKFRYAEPVGVCECYPVRYWYSNDVYVGALSDGKFDGKGVYYGWEIIEGTFRDGKLDGDVRIWRPKAGEVMECRIKDMEIDSILGVYPDSSARFKGMMPQRPERVLTDFQKDYITPEPIIIDYLENKPTFMGGDANEFSKWVNERLVYPEDAKKAGIQGRVTLFFTVGADGRVGNVKVLRGVYPSLDAEAVRVVSMSPAWQPAKNIAPSGLYYAYNSVNYTFPVIFRLPK